MKNDEIEWEIAPLSYLSSSPQGMQGKSKVNKLDTCPPQGCGVVLSRPNNHNPICIELSMVQKEIVKYDKLKG